MKLTARHQARKLAIQAIYSWQLSGNSIIDIRREFLSNQNRLDLDVPYFCELINGVSKYVSELDKKMMPHLSRHLENVGQVEKAVLRLAMFELHYCDNVPYKVIINEAIKLAKVFGAQESYKFINGALDKIITSVYKKWRY